jgi:hypothetical protein
MTMIGIDPHKATHTAVAVDDDEQVIGEFTLEASDGDDRPAAPNYSVGHSDLPGLASPYPAICLARSGEHMCLIDTCGGCCGVS